MDSSGYLTLAAAAGLQRSLDVTANNLANSSSAGYRAARVHFDDLITPRPGATPEAAASYAHAAFTYSDTKAGALVQTANPLDVAIQGEGYFAYETEAGTLALGRDGRLVLDAEGVLRTTSGRPILDMGGGQIALDPEAGIPSIAADGTISDLEGNNIGQIGLFSADIEQWQRIGDTMFQPRDGAAVELIPQEAPTLRQGFSEQSNVNPIAEMVRLIEVQRQFDQVQNFSKNQDQLRQATLSRLGEKA